MDRPAAWPDSERTEGLLAGRPPDPRDPADTRFVEVVRLLTSAARDGVLDPERERAALNAFRAARARADAGLRLARTARPARLLAGGLAAGFAVGAIAVAVAAGALPGPFHPAAP